MAEDQHGVIGIGYDPTAMCLASLSVGFELLVTLTKNGTIKAASGLAMIDRAIETLEEKAQSNIGAKNAAALLYDFRGEYAAICPD